MTPTSAARLVAFLVSLNLAAIAVNLLAGAWYNYLAAFWCACVAVVVVGIYAVEAGR